MVLAGWFGFDTLHGAVKVFFVFLMIWGALLFVQWTIYSIWHGRQRKEQKRRDSVVHRLNEQIELLENAEQETEGEAARREVLRRQILDLKFWPPDGFDTPQAQAKHLRYVVPFVQEHGIKFTQEEVVGWYPSHEETEAKAT